LLSELYLLITGNKRLTVGPSIEYKTSPPSDCQ
jgi:hypothetical protein